MHQGVQNEDWRSHFGQFYRHTTLFDQIRSNWTVLTDETGKSVKVNRPLIKKVDHQKSFELNLGIRRLFAIIQWSNSMQLTVHHRPSTFIVVHHRPSSASTFIELSSNRPLSCNWPSTFIEITVQFGPDSIDLFYKIGRLRREKNILKWWVEGD